MTGTQGRLITEPFRRRAGNSPQTIWEIPIGWTLLPTPSEDSVDCASSEP